LQKDQSSPQLPLLLELDLPDTQPAQVRESETVERTAS
jgi:hypothetical protein